MLRGYTLVRPKEVHMVCLFWPPVRVTCYRNKILMAIWQYTINANTKKSRNKSIYLTNQQKNPANFCHEVAGKFFEILSGKVWPTPLYFICSLSCNSLNLYGVGFLFCRHKRRISPRQGPRDTFASLLESVRVGHTVQGTGWNATTMRYSIS